MAAERSANAEIEMAAALETMKNERALAAEAAKEAERMASVSAKEEAEARGRLGPPPGLPAYLVRKSKAKKANRHLQGLKWGG